jgi:L-asparaginase
LYRYDAAGFTAGETIAPNGEACLVPMPGSVHRPIIYQTRPLPSVLILHTGGTLGMSTKAFEEPEDMQGAAVFKPGTGGDYTKTLQPGKLLLNLVTVVGLRTS